MVDEVAEVPPEAQVEPDRRLPPKKEVKSARSTAHIGKESAGPRKRR